MPPDEAATGARRNRARVRDDHDLAVDDTALGQIRQERRREFGGSNGRSEMALRVQMVAVAAVRALGNLKYKSALPEVLERLRGDPKADVRAAAAAAIGKLELNGIA